MARTAEAKTAGRLVVDTSAKLVTCGGEEVALTATEYAIVALLSKHPGWTHSAEEISLSVWGYTHYSTSVSVHITHIRRKLNVVCPGTYIETVRGLGYRMSARHAGENQGAQRAGLDGYAAPLEEDAFFSRLATMLDLGRSTHSTLHLITGVEGIGKTRCLREAQQRAAQAGWLPVWLDCRLAKQHQSPTWDFAASTLHAHGIAGVPNPRVYDSDPPAATDVALDYERHCEMVASMASQQPVMLLFDDADYMDNHSANVLAHLASECGQHPFGIVVAARDVTWRLRQRFSEHSSGYVELRGMSQEAVRAFAEREGLTWLTEHEIDALTAVTLGIPGRVLDLAREMRGLRPNGELTREALITLSLTPRMRGTLESRLNAMDGAQLEVLRWIAVLDNDADPEMLDQLAGIHSESAWRSLQSALSTGDLAASPESATIRIPDPLLARIVYDQMSPAEKKRRLKSVASLSKRAK